MSLHHDWPTPADFGLSRFPAWRPGQPEAIDTAIAAPTRFTALVLPTGFGKSLVYMGRLAVTGSRGVILTMTRALQRQLAQDFTPTPAELLTGGGRTFTLIQGQQNYECVALRPGGELHNQFAHAYGFQTVPVDHAPCHVGVDCTLKNSAGCTYYDRVRAGQVAETVVTNYAWWHTLVNQPHLRYNPDVLILDEAHDAPDALADALGATLARDLVARVLSENLPSAGTFTPAEWVEWAQARAVKLSGRLEGTSPRTQDAIKAIRRGTVLLRELQKVAVMDPGLLVFRDELDGVRFDLVWAAGFAEQYLFRRVKHVILTSATMTKYTAELLGIIDKDLTFYEAGDGFELARRPVYIAPAEGDFWGTPLRVQHGMTPDQKDRLIAHIDAIIETRLDRKGIIHTVSYDRRDLLLTKSKHASRMLVHDRRNAPDVIAEFRRSGPGTILVSPSVTTGYDFPYQDCEYQILVKVPFPDSRDPIVQARKIINTRYPNHIAMQTLVQTCGRGMRAADDRCETFITDANAVWFESKNRDLAPRWFRAAVRRLGPGQLPTPPRPLVARTQSDATE